MRQKIVDAHIHLWDLNENHYPWLAKDAESMAIDCGDYSSIKRSYLVADLLHDAGDFDVQGVVHIQSNHDPSDHVRETRWLQRIANENPPMGLPQAIIGNIELQADDAAQTLEAHCSYPNMRGIRQILHKGPLDARPYNPLIDPKWIQNFRLLARSNLVFEVHAMPYQADDAAALMRGNPETIFVVTHCGLPLELDEAGVARWKLQMRRYASYPNVFLKLSGFGLFDKNWTAASIRPIVFDCIEIFGDDRCMVASNYPVETLARPYQYVWTSYLQLFSEFSQAEKDRIFFKNAELIYRIKLPNTNLKETK